MAPHATWKGYLKLSLVSCPVAMYTATSNAGRISFNTLNRNTGNRLKQQMLDAETGEPVESADRVKGYPVSKTEYLVVEDDELDALKIESSKVIDIEHFVPRAEVDQLYVESPYYLAPEGPVAQEAFTVIRDAMTRKDVVGLGRVVLSRRERIVMLQPRDKGILLTTLRYADEVRGAGAYFDGIAELKLPEDMIALAEHIISTKAAHFDPQRFVDRYEEAVVSLIRAKQEGRTFVVEETPAPVQATNLMEALRRSIAAEEGKDTKRRPPAPSKSVDVAPAAKARKTRTKKAG